MFLLGDIGNTDVKIFLIDNKYKPIRKFILKTNLLSSKYLNLKLKFLNKKKIILTKFFLVVLCQMPSIK